MKQIVILGAGTGGALIANMLSHKLNLKEWVITIVDRSDSHVYQPGLLFLPFGLYGHDDFEASMEALKFFTRFGSSEFAVREFLKRDLPRTLAVMEVWSRDGDEHVRRLACEGCRPRLPWSFQLGALIADPAPVVPILENLKADPSLYVRKSVANHLNDITKKHPDWVMDRLTDWPLENSPTACCTESKLDFHTATAPPVYQPKFQWVFSHPKYRSCYQ